MGALKNWLNGQGIGAEHVDLLAAVLTLLALALASVAAYAVTRGVIVRLVRTAVRKTHTHWDDEFVAAKVFSRLSHLVPAMILHKGIPLALADYADASSFVTTLTFVYMALVGMTVVDAALNASAAIYRRLPVSKRVHLTAFVQVFKVVVYCIGGLIILGILVGKSPLVIISGLGAFAAVLMLVFKDALLGFVAGVQLTANNMVRRGDWLEMPTHNADGDVLDVGLTTVKVQNWDKTITTIPTYALVSESFKNWRGMSESGGRRIKRAIQIDMTSIKFCNEEMLERFKRIRYISDYIERKLEKISEFNRGIEADETLLINGRHLTNIGTFRAYLQAYLRHHPKIKQDLTFLVRQLPPSERGLPIEIYVFSNDQRWANYEDIQSDIFDHVLAIVPLFDLRVFQSPTGADIGRLVLAGSTSGSSASAETRSNP